MRDLWKSSKPWERGLLAVLLIWTVVAAVACNPAAPTPVPSSTNVNQNVVINVGQNPTGSPAPGQGGTIDRVGIGAFGEQCPAGKSIAGSERDNDVRLGCTVAITCSAFVKGVEQFDASVIGSAPQRFLAISGEGTAVRSSTPSNPFNLDVLGLAAGPAVYECVIAGVSSNSGPSGPYRLTVVP